MTVVVDVDGDVDVGVLAVLLQPHMFGQFSATYAPRYVSVLQCFFKLKLHVSLSRPHGPTVCFPVVSVVVLVVCVDDVAVVVTHELQSTGQVNRICCLR